MEHDTSRDLRRLWGEGAVRAILSHTSKYKREVAEVGSFLERYGIACFVAHQDIEPMKEWQTEILRALRTANLLIAFLTDDFRSSKWTDQEVGIAIGRQLPVIPVRLGSDPHGLMGKYQALNGTFDQIKRRKGTATIAKDILETMLKEASLSELGKDAYVQAVSNSANSDRANYLASLLPHIDSLTPAQTQGLMDAFNENDQVHHSFDFHDNLVGELSRITGFDFYFAKSANGWSQLISVDLLFGE